MAEPTAIPVAYGTPIDATSSFYTMVDSVVTAIPDLRATMANGSTSVGGRSTRVLLPPQDNRVMAGPEPLSQSIMDTLTDQGFTRGLAEALMKNKLAFPLRIWIVDNSGSMTTNDGHRFVESRRKTDVKLIQCTRWAEMQQTVDYHAQMAALLKCPTVFRMLNDPGRLCGPQQFSIAERGDALIDEDLARAQTTIANVSPNGVTPLTEHLHEIRNNILQMEHSLRESGSKVVVVIATDGTPTDSRGYTCEMVQRQFVEALKGLEGLPVWVVVRLCTDNESVVEYWNNMDSQLELSLEVLDDFVSEGTEVCQNNRWLNYGLPIHRMREMGFHHRLFDLLDERMLTKDELREFCRILFGDGKMDGVPDPQSDWDGFVAAITNLVGAESKQWNPVTKRVEPWIDIRQLKRDYGGGFFSSFFW